MENLLLVQLFEIARVIDSSVISDSRLDGLRNCASWLWFALLNSGRKKLVKANFCRLRLCPMCAWRRSLKLFSQVSAISDAIMSDKPVRFIFVTFTIRNVSASALRDTIKRMNLGFQYLTQDKMKMPVSKVLRQNLLGYMKAIEVTYSIRRDDYHPHIHCIFEVAPTYFEGKEHGYISQFDWRQMWQSVMKLDYLPQVNVRAIETDARPKAVAELAKYPVKMSGLLKIRSKKKAAKALIELKQAIHNCRFVTFGGDFKEYKRRLMLDDVERGDLTHIETDKKTLNAVAIMLYKYRADAGAYIC